MNNNRLNFLFNYFHKKKNEFTFKKQSWNNLQYDQKPKSPYYIARKEIFSIIKSKKNTLTQNEF